MASRYDRTFIVTGSKKIETDGNIKMVRRVSTIFYPNFSNVENNQILSQEGDRLDILAKEYYGDETLWFVIAKANNLGKGSLDVPPGIILKIPFYTENSGIYSFLDEYNNNER